ncbi:epithelial-stromal interaction protein 1 isoform X2 [Pseudophryne corroboree]|uniref:epithelial-stromal interaction protein 1 isoform X2 n=1 Tax=Pseudophryne corroboree TaxID=495146 RepID=UPI003081ED49
MYGQYPGAGRGSNRQTFQNSDQSGNKVSDGGDYSNTGMGEEQPAYSNQRQVNPQSAPQTFQEPQYNDAYVVIPPNQAKRERLLKRGRTSESEARWQQQQMQSQSKYQKMLQREDYKRKLKEEEEVKIQQMKDIQRQKAEKLEEKRRQQDKERRERWHESRSITNNEFLDRLSQLENNSRNHSSIEKTTSEWVNEQDEDYILQQVLKESRQMHKAEEEERQRKMKEMQHTQSRSHAVAQDLDEEICTMQRVQIGESSKPSLQTYMQQQKEEERQLKHINEQQSKKPTRQTYLQLQKAEEERRLKQHKDEQRRKSELLEQQDEARRQSQQEDRRRVNRAFLDRLQRQNTSAHDYSGVSNTWT